MDKSDPRSRFVWTKDDIVIIRKDDKTIPEKPKQKRRKKTIEIRHD